MLSSSTLTIFFQDPFWVGLYQRHDQEGWSACRIVFGGEPRDQEVYQFLLANWSRLRFSPVLPSAPPQERKRSPKRTQREIHRATAPQPLGTKAQRALALQREAGAQARRERDRREKAEEQERRYALRQQKRKEKHRGR